MKKSLFSSTSLLLIVFCVVTMTNAQTLKADYQFQGNLNSSVVGAPAMMNLTGSGGANSFVTDTVDGYMRQSLRFPFNSGVAVNTTGVIPNTSYTVVVLFRFDQLTGYRRVMDTTNGSNQCGGYILDYRFESEATTNNSVLFPNLYVQGTLVREASGRVRVYRDGYLKVDVANDDGCFAISNNLIRFFQDDFQQGGEASPGNVARI